MNSLCGILRSFFFYGIYFRLRVGNFLRLLFVTCTAFLFSGLRVQGLNAQPVIDCLLGCGQRLIFHLQLHGLADIRTLTEPQNQVVTGIYAFLCLPCSRVKLCQLECPALGVFPFPILLQDSNLRVQRGILCPVQLVLKNTAGIIILRDL